MTPRIKSSIDQPPSLKQRGVVLFFALMALLAMSLAAVALIRSVDTSTMISGNLAFKQAATTSGDAGTEAALNWLDITNVANNALSAATNTAHPFNRTGGIGGFQNPGYYSNLNPNINLTDGTGIQWDNNDSCGIGPNCTDSIDASGNTVRYVIQRMCRTAGALPSTLEQPALVPPTTDCLFGDKTEDKNSQAIVRYQEKCEGSGCSKQELPPQYRITTRIQGPRNSVSYVQAFVY